MCATEQWQSLVWCWMEWPTIFPATCVFLVVSVENISISFLIPLPLTGRSLRGKKVYKAKDLLYCEEDFLVSLIATFRSQSCY